MIVREIHARIGFGRRCVEIIIEYDQRQKGIVSKCDTQTPELASGKLCIVDHSHLVPQCPISYDNACELSRMEAMVWMEDNDMGSNMYQCVRLLRSTKNMVL